MEGLAHSLIDLEQQIRELSDKKNALVTQLIQVTRERYPTVYVLLKSVKPVPADPKTKMPGLIPFEDTYSKKTFGCFSCQQLADDYVKKNFHAGANWIVRAEATINVSDFRILNLDKEFA